MREPEAILDTVNKIEDFKKKFGKEAVRVAINYGAFHNHPDFGDVSRIFVYRDFNEETIIVPQWISDMFNYVE